jgi:hypothetical protein
VNTFLSLSLRAAVAGGITWAAWRWGGGGQASMISLLFCGVIWAVLFAKPIVDGLGAYVWWARKEPYIPWEGRYYEFQNVHIRIFEEDGKLWFAAEDVLKVLGRKPDSTLAITYGEIDYRLISGAAAPPLRVFSTRAAREIIVRARHPEAGKFLFWFDREVVAPFEKAKEIRASSGKIG